MSTRRQCPYCTGIANEGPGAHDPSCPALKGTQPKREFFYEELVHPYEGESSPTGKGQGVCSVPTCHHLKEVGCHAVHYESDSTRLFEGEPTYGFKAPDRCAFVGISDSWFEMGDVCGQPRAWEWHRKPERGLYHEFLSLDAVENPNLRAAIERAWAKNPLRAESSDFDGTYEQRHPDYSRRPEGVSDEDCDKAAWADEPPPLDQPLHRAAWFYARNPSIHNLISLRAVIAEEPRDVSSDPVCPTCGHEALHDSANNCAACYGPCQRDISSDPVDGKCHRPLGGNGEWCTTHDTDFPSGAHRCNAPRDIWVAQQNVKTALRTIGFTAKQADIDIAVIQREAVEPWRKALRQLVKDVIDTKMNDGHGREPLNWGEVNVSLDRAEALLEDR